MMQELRRDLRSKSTAEAAYNGLPPIARSVITHWLDCMQMPPEEGNTEFQAILRNELLAAEWDTTVGLVQALKTPEAEIALARKRYDLERELSGKRGDGRGTIPNAQIVLDTICLHIALNHQAGSLNKNGIERHIKHGPHAPFPEFANPEMYMTGFEKGVAVIHKGKNTRVVVPSLEAGAVVLLTKKNSQKSIIVQTTQKFMPEQIAHLKALHTYGGYDAVILHGTRSLPMEPLRRQLQSSVARGGHVHDVQVPFVQFGVAMDPDHGEVVFDSEQTPEWIAADVSRLSQRAPLSM